MQQGYVLSPLPFAVVSSETRSGLPSELLYASDLALMAPIMAQLGRRVAEWRASLLTKGLKMNSAKYKVMVGSSVGKMIVNSGNLCCCLLLFAFLDLWDEMGPTSMFSSLENCQFHHTRLESLEHLIVVIFYI